MTSLPIPRLLIEKFVELQRVAAVRDRVIDSTYGGRTLPHSVTKAEIRCPGRYVEGWVVNVRALRSDAGLAEAGYFVGRTLLDRNLLAAANRKVDVDRGAAT